MAKDILKKDLYLILEVEETASDKELLKGYRKKALKCHPDKNPDNPKAAELFHELSQALEILTDPAARAAYDRSRKAKKEVEARNQALDSQRKKFKDDLEAREQAAEQNLKKVSQADANKKLLAEIERLRKEGSRLLEEEQKRLHEILKTSQPQIDKEQNTQPSDEAPRLKLKWKAAKGDANNGGYSEKVLSDIFSCYGRISTLLISSKRNGSALIEFESSGVLGDILDETGLAENPLSMVWLCGKPSEKTQSPSCFPDIVDVSSFHHTHTGNEDSSVKFISGMESTNTSGATFLSGDSHAGTGPSADFESLVLRKMRQAEEWKRLIEQMAREDEENG